MTTKNEDTALRAQALAFANSTPGIFSHEQVLKAARGYLAFLRGETLDSGWLVEHMPQKWEALRAIYKPAHAPAAKKASAKKPPAAKATARKKP